MNNCVDRSILVVKSRQTVAALFILFSQRLYGDDKNLMAYKVRLPTKHGSKNLRFHIAFFGLLLGWNFDFLE